MEFNTIEEEIEYLNNEIKKLRVLAVPIFARLKRIRCKLHGRWSNKSDRVKKKDMRNNKKQNRDSLKHAEKHCSRWSDRDEMFLAENMDTLTALEISKRLGRTVKSIKGKREKIKSYRNELLGR